MATEKEETKISTKAARIRVEEAEKAAEQARKVFSEVQIDKVREQIAKTKKISRKQLGKTKLPDYFDPRKKYDNQATENEAINKAMNFLLGIRYEVDEETGTKKKFHVDSYSAKITYTGGRRLISKRIKLGKEKANPNTNNWRIFMNAARFFSGEEYKGFIKDPKFIRNCLTGDNFIVKFVKDKRSKTRNLKKQTLERDEKRALGMSLRIRENKLRLGVKFPLKPAEARQLLENDKAYNKKMLDEGKEEKDIEPYFPEETKKYILETSKKKEPEKE